MSGRTKGFSPWREELKRAWRELRGPETTPGRAAISMAIGLFVGSLPIFGCHTPIVIALSLWFQLDAAIAWIASNVSNPFFAPALLTVEVKIGAWICHGPPMAVDGDFSRAVALRHLVGYMFLGAPVAGGVLALFGGAVTYGVLALSPKTLSRPPYRLPDDAPPWVKSVERIATRFASPLSPTPRERTRFHFLRAKLLGDPVAKMIADVASDEPCALGSLLDLGTGRGQLPLLLIELGRASSVRGIDWDDDKIADARRAAGPRSDGIPALDAIFTRADVRTVPFETANTVLLIDLLHYFSISEQDAILDRAAAAVLPGGRLLVREAEPGHGWRSLMTLAEERFFTLVRLNRGERVRFRPVADIAARLEAGGIRCSIRPAWGKTPFSNVLLIGRRAP